MQMGGRALEEGFFITACPNFVSARATAQAAAPGAGIVGDETSVDRPRKSPRKNSPHIISIPARGESDFVAPSQKQASCASVSESCNRQRPEFALNEHDFFGVIGSRPLCQIEECRRCLILLQYRLKGMPIPIAPP